MDDDEGDVGTFLKEDCERQLNHIDNNLGFYVYQFCARSCGLYKSFLSSTLSDEESTCLKTCGTNFMNWKNDIQPG